MSAEAVPFTVWLRRPDGSIGGHLTDFRELSLVVRWHDVSRWTLVTDDSDALRHFSDRRAGVVVKRGTRTVLSGIVDYRRVEYAGGVPSLTVGGPDDTARLAWTQAWPRPSAAVTSQTDSHDKRTGPAETLIRDYTATNLVARLGRAVTLPASQGRGSTRTFRARFTPLLEIAQTVASDGRIGFRLAQFDDRTIGLDVWEPADLRSQGGLFSDLVGTLEDWSWSEEAPTATRTVVGGGDQGSARRFFGKVDAAAESEWDREVEDFTDRRDIDPADATATAELSAQADETLAESTVTLGMRLAVTDRPGQQYGIDYEVGDLVRAYPAGVRLDDRVTEVEVTVNSDGDRVTMWVGRKDPDPDERVEKRARTFARHLGRLDRVY